MEEAYHSRGFSLDKYVDIDGVKGDFRCLVYNETECGECQIQKSKLEGRSVYWIPEVQT